MEMYRDQFGEFGIWILGVKGLTHLHVVMTLQEILEKHKSMPIM